MSAPKRKVVLAMSGGVDSSVAAALLLRQGYEVIGAFMRLGGAGLDPEDHGHARQGCCSVLDAVDARRVAGTLGIPLYVLNFQDGFDRVIDYFTSEYNKGRTPNPCVRCNDWLKFGRLADYAKAVGADFVASGHYARIGIDPATGERALLRAVDTHKDQSYVLFGMSRQTLQHTLLPIGEFQKPQIRQMAEEMNLPVFNKPDSQEICFVPGRDYAAVVRHRSPDAVRPGELVLANGETVGTHEGHQHFTIGQRKGVRLALGHPVYVTSIDAESNRVTLGEKQSLLRHGLVADQTNWLAARPEPGGAAIRCSAKIRYNHDPQPAEASLNETGELIVRFDEPQSAITPGQAVAVYDGDVLLGGGWIQRALDE